MDDDKIKDVFEKFFDKYKKTEGDESAWSAFFTQHAPEGTFEINLTKCPRGNIFKPFAKGRKLPEVEGWENFSKAMKQWEKEHPDLFSADKFFSEMKDIT